MALTPEIDSALTEIADGLGLSPELREEIASRIPRDATTETDLPEDLAWMLSELRKNKPAGRELALAGSRITFSTAVLDPRVSACPDKPHLDPDDDGEDMMAAALPRQWRGQLVPYDNAAPDGRIIKAPAGEPKSREMPLPFNAQIATADGHDNAITIGRVNRIWSQDGALWGEGEFDLGTPEGRDWAGRVARGMAGWGSVDLDAGTAPRVESQGRNKVPKRTYPDWTFAGFTLVSRPAFDSARITAHFGDEETIDDERNAQMPGMVEEILSGIDEMFDASDDVAASNNGCGCGGSAETLTFPGGGEPYLPMAPAAHPWNPAEAVARVRAWAGAGSEDDTSPEAYGQIGKAFFYHDQDDDSFKLPFADVINGELTAVPAGIQAAARLVESGRAGIPETDLEPVKAKISAYFREMNMTPPWPDTAVETMSADTVVTFPASGKTSLPLGPPTDWDSADAVKRVQAWAGVDKADPSPAAWSKFGQAFFWSAPSASKLGDFKFPFADVVDGSLKAMPRGIAAAAGAIQGARSTPDIPEGDVAKVRAKIGAYYRKMKRKAPWDSNAMTASLNSSGLVYTSDGIAGTVTGYDAEAGWLRISSSAHAAIITPEEGLDPEYLTASATGPAAPPDAWFDNPNLNGPAALTVDDDGRVFGHLAVFGTCHVGFSDVCVTPPRSNTGYSYFHTGEVVAASGARIPVGKIVMGPGHAGPYAGWRAATMHYDKSGATIAVGRVGEDAHGIWFSGSLVPEIKPSQVASLRRSPLSGDWRKIGGNLELVAALAVSVPGFPIPRPRASVTYGQQTALVAAGVVDREQLSLQASLAGIVQNALENALESYADRRQRAAEAMRRIQGSDDSGGCGCQDHDDEDEE